MDWPALLSAFLLLYFGTTKAQWATLSPTGSTVPRTDAASVYSPTYSQIVVHGGFGGTEEASTSNVLSSMVKYSVDSNQWISVTATGANPGARMEHSAVLTSAENMLIFGGKQADQVSYYDNIFSFNIGTNVWTAINPTGTKPAARSGHSAVMTSRDTMIVFGGELSTSAVSNELWKYDLNTNKWTLLQAQGTSTSRPAGRKAHTAVLNSANQLIITGGYDLYSEFQETWMYDMGNGNWTLISSTTPSARSNHVAALTNQNQMYTFGGVGNSVYLNDMSRLTAITWSSVSQSGVSIRRSPVFQYVAKNNAIYLFGGRAFSILYFDIYRYTLPSVSPVQMYYAVERGGPTNFTYTFKLKRTGAMTGDVDAIYFADKGAGGPTYSQGLTSPTIVQLPTGFTTMQVSSSGTHIGPFFNNAGAGWTPAAVNDSITWKVTATNYVPAGRLYWSADFGTATPDPNFLEVLLSCKEADGSSDKDGDSYSYCDYFDKSYYDCADSNNNINPSITEICNNVDDNCDGQIDTDITVFEPLPIQLGVCNGYNKTCVSGAWVSNYNIIPTYHSPEGSYCDGLDSDCDGTTDNNLTPPPASKQNGVCAGSVKQCVSGAWQEPNYSLYSSDYEATETRCDGKDGNCNGVVDDVPANSGPLLTKQAGVCSGKRQSCIAGAWADNYTIVSNYSSPEGLRCDLLDNDCDGTPDNNLTPPAAQKNLGVCANATKQCVSGAWVEPNYTQIPNYQAVETLCSGLDEDCDGTVDNIAPASRPALAKQAGVCSGYKQTCVSGSWQNQYSVVPQYADPEGLNCDNKDNDCDGVVDNHLTPPLGALQSGVCAGSITVCNSTGQRFEEPNYLLIPDYQVQESSCDGKDNDCDGVVDTATAEPLDRQGGPCFGRFKICKNGVPENDYSWFPQFEPDEVTCDNIDNDCDDKVDEKIYSGLTANQQGVCLGAKKTCENGVFKDIYDPDVIQKYEAQEVSCDGLDNQCRGKTDFGLTGPPAAKTSGVCVGQTKTCGGVQGWIEPNYSLISTYEGSGEISCDSLDNNCDGTVDNMSIMGNLTDNQVGVCNGTIKKCRNGAWENDYTKTVDGTITGYSALELFCNGLDENCNGQVDENLTPPLASNQNGVCENSTKLCGGLEGWKNPNLTTISGYMAVEPDVCNGIDENCNSYVDDTPNGTCAYTNPPGQSTAGDTDTPATLDLDDLDDVFGSGDHELFGRTFGATEYYLIIIAMAVVSLAIVIACVYVFWPNKKKKRGQPPFPPGFAGWPMPPMDGEMQPGLEMGENGFSYPGGNGDIPLQNMQYGGPGPMGPQYGGPPPMGGQYVQFGGPGPMGPQYGGPPPMGGPQFGGPAPYGGSIPPNFGHQVAIAPGQPPQQQPQQPRSPPAKLSSSQNAPTGPRMTNSLLNLSISANMTPPASPQPQQHLVSRSLQAHPSIAELNIPKKKK